MLNQIVRLQAIIEIISNQTTRSLEFLSRQQTRNKATIYQTQLVLDYLLAGEGGPCGKF
ncbi:ENR1 protein, partial [Mionectes macconnelli]|nr:ENR1 protein [Mionectes macconnelli]